MFNSENEAKQFDDMHQILELANREDIELTLAENMTCS
jgi:hypothetical protein